MATLGLGIIINIVLRNESQYTGGPDGMPVMPLSVFGFEVMGDMMWYWIVATLLCISIWASLNLINSPFGRALRALHGSEVAAQVAGVKVARYKAIIFVMSAVFASLMGSVMAHYIGFVTPSVSDFPHSIELLTMVVVGGVASVYGSVVGAVLLTALPQALAHFEGWETVAYGAILVGCMIFVPKGVVPTLANRFTRAWIMMLLEASGISKSFGGVHAVQNVSFSVEEGHIYSVIGPNGAGKTTLFNLITGVYTADRGGIRLRGEALHQLPASALAAKGVARTFQNLQICMNMTALENVMVGAHLHMDRNLFKAVLRLPSIRNGDRRLAEEAAQLMTSVGLGNYVRAHADSLSYGVLKRLEIARALAMKPTILFLDEPAAGLNPIETEEIAQVIRRVRDSGITVVLVEHDMKMVMRLSDRILVMESGKTLTEGTAEEIRHHPQVISAYLGTPA